MVSKAVGGLSCFGINFTHQQSGTGIKSKKLKQDSLLMVTVKLKEETRKRKLQLKNWAPNTDFPRKKMMSLSATDFSRRRYWLWR